MSRIRDIANLFSANTDAATDAEVASAISSHNTTANGHVKRGNTASRPASPSNGDVYANTETGYFEHYDGTDWTAVGAAASTPSSVVATNQGSGRAYNNGQASVAFSAGTITGSTYTVTSSPGSYTSSGASSPLVVTGLQSSTQYTYTVVAANKFGSSAASTASSGVTATTVPQSPTIDSIISNEGNSAIITFTAGATGGAAITQYSITSNPATTTQTTSSSPYTFTGLTTGTAYTFTITAINSNGTSTGTTSSSVTIEEPDSGAMFPIYTTTLTTSASSITFSNIPSTYTRLQIRFSTLNGATGGTFFRFNNDNGSSYSSHYLYGNGTGLQTGIYGASTEIYVSNHGTEIPTIGIIDVLDYKDTNKFKTTRSFAGNDTNNTNNTAIALWSGNYRSFTAINSFTIFPSGTTFSANTKVSLYGIE